MKRKCSLCPVEFDLESLYTLPRTILDHYRAEHPDLVFAIYALRNVKT